jgi:hypothetical protein
MFGPWRLWDNILSRFLPRCLTKRCQTDHWPLYNDSYSHTVIPWSLQSVLGSFVSKQQWPTAKFLTVALLVLQIIWNVFSPLVTLVCTLQMQVWDSYLRCLESNWKSDNSNTFFCLGLDLLRHMKTWNLCTSQQENNPRTSHFYCNYISTDRRTNR